MKALETIICLVIKSGSLFCRTLPQQLGLTLASFLVVAFLFDLAWPYLLPPLRSGSYDRLLALVFLGIPLSYWTACSTFLLSEAESGNRPGLLELLKFGFKATQRALLVFLAGFLALRSFTMLLRHLGDSTLAVSLLFCLICVLVVAFPVSIHTFILGGDNFAFGRRTNALGLTDRGGFLVTMVLFLAVGFYSISGLGHYLQGYTFLKEHHIAFLLWLSLISLPVLLQAAFAGLVSADGPRGFAGRDLPSQGVKLSEKKALALLSTVFIATVGLLIQNFSQRQEVNNRLLSAALKLRPGDPQADVMKSMLESRPEALMTRGDIGWVLTVYGLKLPGSPSIIVELTFCDAEKLLHRKISTGDSTNALNAPPDF